MIEFNDKKAKSLEDVFKSIKGSRASFSVEGKKLREVASEIVKTGPKAKVRRVERSDSQLVPAVKTKKKDGYIDSYVDSILKKYEAELDRSPDTEYRYGKIIDWGTVPLGELVDKLLITLETMCNVVLFPYQKVFAARVMHSVLLNDGEEITALWARQSGKSETITDVIATLMVMLPILAGYFPQLAQFKAGIYVGVFAPTEPQAKTIGERFRLRIRGDLAKEFLTDPEVDLKVQDLFMSNGSYVRIHSAAPQAKVESKTYHIIIIDEAQDVSDDKILKCYKFGTPFNMVDGTVRSIEDVVKNKITVLTPDGEVVPDEWLSTGKQECFKVVLDSGRELSITDLHRHLCFRKGWKQPKEFNTKEIIEYIERVGAVRLAVPQKLEYFGNYGNYNRGLILGYFLGDGCVRNAPQFCGFAESWGVLNSAVFSEFDCKVVMYPASKNGLIEGQYSRKNTWRNPLTEWFREIGIWGKKGSNKCIPNLPYTREFVKGLIQGLFETDGCVESYDAKPIISFANISEKLVRGLQDQLLKFGVHSRIFKRKQNGGFGKDPEDLWILHIKDVDSIRIFGEIGLLSKNDKLKMAVTCIAGKAGRNFSGHYSSELRFDRIRSIEMEGIFDTYCVKVPTDGHWVIANGIVSGNSIHPMGSATSATIIKLGTPNMQQCEFLDAIHRNERIFDASRGKVRNHFAFDYKTVIRYNERYARFIAKEKARYGEESDYFRMSYCLQWLLSRGMAVGAEMFEKHMRAPMLKLEKRGLPQYSYVAGLDLGKKFDSTVLTTYKLLKNEGMVMSHDVRGIEDTVAEDVSLNPSDYYRKIITDWLEMEGDNWEAQVSEIVEYLSRFPSMLALAVDSTGVGDPIHEALSRRLAHTQINVIPVYFTLRQQHLLAQCFYRNVNYNNVKVPCHGAVKETKKWQRFYNQLKEAEKIWKNDKMVIRHPNKRGAKDDYVQSMLLGLWAADIELNEGAVVEMEGNLYKSTGDEYDTLNIEHGFGKIDAENIVGFEKIRKLAREGRLEVSRGAFKIRGKG